MADVPILGLSWTVVALLATWCGRAEASSLLSTSETLVYGPGLHEDTSSLPLNYFFIQARDSTGVK